MGGKRKANKEKIVPVISSLSAWEDNKKQRKREKSAGGKSKKRKNLK